MLAQQSKVQMSLSEILSPLAEFGIDQTNMSLSEARLLSKCQSQAARCGWWQNPSTKIHCKYVQQMI